MSIIGNPITLGGTGGGLSSPLIDLTLSSAQNTVQLDIDADWLTDYDSFVVGVDVSLTAADWIYTDINAFRKSGPYSPQVSTYSGVYSLLKNPLNSWTWSVPSSDANWGYRHNRAYSNPTFIAFMCFTETKYFDSGSRFRLFGIKALP